MWCLPFCWRWYPFHLEGTPTGKNKTRLGVPYDFDTGKDVLQRGPPLNLNATSPSPSETAASAGSRCPPAARCCPPGGASPRAWRSSGRGPAVALGLGFTREKVGFDFNHRITGWVNISVDPRRFASGCVGNLSFYFLLFFKGGSFGCTVGKWNHWESWQLMN